MCLRAIIEIGIKWETSDHISCTSRDQYAAIGLVITCIDAMATDMRLFITNWIKSQVSIVGHYAAFCISVLLFIILDPVHLELGKTTKLTGF